MLGIGVQVFLSHLKSIELGHVYITGTFQEDVTNQLVLNTFVSLSNNGLLAWAGPDFFYSPTQTSAGNLGNLFNIEKKHIGWLVVSKFQPS